MADAYRKLGEGLPPRRAPDGVAFPTDVKRVAAWIEALPRANQAATLRQLSEALDTLAEVRFDGGLRLAILEALRPSMLEAIEALELQVGGGTVPLAPAKARTMEQLVQFERGLAHGYRLAVLEHCAPSGSVPFLRGGNVATAIVRSLYHSARCLLHAYFVYQAPVAGSWQRLHAAFAFARQVKLVDKAVEDPHEAQPLSAQGVYLQTVLLALSNPYRFSQKEQVELWRLCGELAVHLQVSDRKPNDEAFCLPIDSDQGPGFIPEERAGESATTVWLDLKPLRDLIEPPLATATSGPLQIRARGARPIATTAELLRRLRGGWGAASTRRNQRLTAEHSLNAVVGLAAVHFYLAGMLDFDTFLQQAGVAEVRGKERAAWTHAGVDAARIPVYPTEVLDQSLGGYRVRWSESENVRARVGELVGLSVEANEDERQWMLAAIRWLRYEADGSVSAGLELLSRRARAVAVRAAEGNSAARSPQRGVQYHPAREGVAGGLHVVLASALDSLAGSAEVVRVPDLSDLEQPEPSRERVESLRVLENAGDYLLARFQRAGAE